MRLKQKCAKCRVDLVHFRMVLMMGPKGFRSYACCEKCADKVDAKTVKLLPVQKPFIGDRDEQNKN